MTKINIQVELSDWDRGYYDDEGYLRGGEEFHEFLEAQIVNDLAGKIYAGLDKLVIKQIQEKALKAVEAKMQKSINRILNNGVLIDNNKQKLSDIIGSAIHNWKVKDTNFRYNNEIKSLKSMIDEHVLNTLNRDSKKS